MKGFESMYVIGGVAIFVIAFVRLFLLNPKAVGKRGEARVARRLRKGLPGEYAILNGVYLPLEDGTTTQIDHVVVSRYGVFVVETKNYSGWIFGNGADAEWTQTFRNRKSRFQNPIRQNYRHVCAIADALGISKTLIHGLVVFTGDCEFKTAMPDGVTYSRDAAGRIREFKTPVVESEKAREIAEAIASWDSSVGDARKAAHVANLKKRRGCSSPDSAPPRCPVCGAPMVLRHRRTDNRPFYGCSRYPGCKGIVNV